jgi:hypothetical protein
MIGDELNYYNTDILYQPRSVHNLSISFTRSMIGIRYEIENIENIELETHVKIRTWHRADWAAFSEITRSCSCNWSNLTNNTDNTPAIES